MNVQTDLINAFLEQTRELLAGLDRAAIARARDLLLDCHSPRARVHARQRRLGLDRAALRLRPRQVRHPARPAPFDARCLTDNISLYTAWANDADRADVFANLMRGLLQRGDVVIACSVHGGTGFSADLVRAVRFANGWGADRSAWSASTAACPPESTVSILVPVASTPQVEAIHLVIEHSARWPQSNRPSGANSRTLRE